MTNKEVYQNIYNAAKQSFLSQGYSKIDSEPQSASRKANLIAVKSTWKTFNDILISNNS